MAEVSVMPDMPDLIEILESFNRKERFFLVAQALYEEREDPKFELSDAFREKLGTKVGIIIPTEKVFVAMDYHLNWVHASLVLFHYSEESDSVSLLNLEGTIEGNQRDIDLLVAFYNGDKYHLIFVEAKAYDGDGYAGFGKGELVKKVERLEKIINLDKESGHQDVETYFCLMSGYKPQNLTKDWPEWNGKPLLWMPLSLPENRYVLNYSEFSIVEQEKVDNQKQFNSKTVVSGKKGSGKVDEGQE